jgi:hypothetical protein
MTAETLSPCVLQPVRLSAGRYVIARQDPTDPRRWYAPAGEYGIATGRLQDLPTLAGVRTYRGPTAARRAMDLLV